ncbi:MAG: hypothetical protein ACKOC8_08325 [Pirellulales bacterium]
MMPRSCLRDHHLAVFACGLPWERGLAAPNGRPFRIGNQGKPVSAVLA